MQEEKEGTVFVGKSGIVFPVAVPRATPQSYSAKMVFEQFIILKCHENVLAAKEQAEAEYNTFFAEFHPHIHRSTHVILRERFAHLGQIGYLIHVEVEATELKMAEIKLWTDGHIHSDKAN